MNSDPHRSSPSASSSAEASSAPATPPTARDLSAEDIPLFTADRQNRFTIICPACKDARNLDGEKLRAVKQPATMKCRCGKIFKCRFKFFEPDFPPEDALAIAPHEALDLPEFSRLSSTKPLSKEAHEAALANRQALLTFHNLFSEDALEEEAPAPVDPETLLRGAPLLEDEDTAPLSDEAAENIGFALASSAPQTAQGQEGNAPATEDEHESNARALAVLRLANLEKKRAREAMESAEADRQEALTGLRLAVQEQPSPGQQRHAQAPETLPAEELYQKAYQEKQQAEIALQHAELRRLQAEMDARRQQMERERQELAALRNQLEQERISLLQDKAVLARALRQRTALPPPARPVALPKEAGLPVFSPDATGRIQVECPHCHAKKRIAAAEAARVKQPARMQCRQCGTKFQCRFDLTPRSSSPTVPPEPANADVAKNVPTFFADLAGKVTLVCPFCQTGKTVASEQLRNVAQPATIRCSACNASFPCRFVLDPPASTSEQMPHVPPSEPEIDPAVTMRPDTLGRFARSLQEEAAPSNHAGGEELASTMTGERLQQLYTGRTEQQLADAAVSLVGEDLSDFFQQLDLEAPPEASVAASRNLAPPEPQAIPQPIPQVEAEVLPSLPFETVLAPVAREIPTYYVDEKRQVMVMCPKCERARNLDLFNHPTVGPVIRTWCKCGHEHFCRLEFRRNYRKKVNLPGLFFVPATGQRGEMVVNDISLGGLGFTLDAACSLKPETVVDVSFQLDDLKRTPIQRRLRVRAVKGRVIGSEFLEHRERDKDLGYYLMP